MTKRYSSVVGRLGTVIFEIRAETASKSIVGGAIRTTAPPKEGLHKAIQQSTEELGLYLRDTAGALLRPIVEATDTLPNLAEVEIEFGLKITGKATIYVVEGSSESHIRVRAKWIRPNDQKR